MTMTEYAISRGRPTVVFGGFRVFGIDVRGGNTSRRAKFAFFTAVPSDTPVRARASAGMQKGNVLSILKGAHIELDVPSVGEITPEAVEAKLRSVGGAHQPQRFEFIG